MEISTVTYKITHKDGKTYTVDSRIEHRFLANYYNSKQLVTKKANQEIKNLKSIDDTVDTVEIIKIK